MGRVWLVGLLALCGSWGSAHAQSLSETVAFLMLGQQPNGSIKKTYTTYKIVGENSFDVIFNDNGGSQVIGNVKIDDCVAVFVSKNDNTGKNNYTQLNKISSFVVERIEKYVRNEDKYLNYFKPIYRGEHGVYCMNGKMPGDGMCVSEAVFGHHEFETRPNIDAEAYKSRLERAYSHLKSKYCSGRAF